MYVPRLRFKKLLYLILLIICSGIALQLYFVIQRERLLSHLYISKNNCEYHASKSIVIFIDNRTQDTLSKYGIELKDILKTANQEFKKYKLLIRYDIDSFKKRKWDSESSECLFLNAKFSKEQDCLENEVAPKVKLERRITNPDVIIFLTALSFYDISGKSFWIKPAGNGTIVINLGAYPYKLQSDNRPKSSAKIITLRSAQLIIHENLHLYGVEHSTETYSIMKSNLDYLGDRRIHLDTTSFQSWKAADDKLQSLRESCAAQ